MKRFILLLLTFILTFTLTACSGGGGEPLAEYSSTFSFDDEMHWRSQTNGTGSTDLGEHEDNGLGVCSVCGCVLYEINYASTFSFDDERHWRELPNGAGRTEEGVHTEIEEGGKCATCNYYYDATEFLSFEKCKIGNVNGYRVIEMLD